MMNFSDDRGIHKNNAKVLKIEIFPANPDIDFKYVEDMLKKLLDKEMLLISEDQKLLKFVNWDTYQKIQHKTPSKYEDDDGNITIPFTYYYNNDTITVPLDNNKDTIPLPHNITKVTKVKENNKSNVQNKDFELFYNSYPRKSDRKRAERAFKNLTKRNKELCIGSVSRYVQWLKDNNIDDKTLIKLPSTYINGEHWNDELELNGNRTMYKSEDYKLDTTGNARIGYCSSCYRSDFYDPRSINTIASNCCGTNLLPLPVEETVDG
tara:strand:- start:41 stop:835 length:795 start_codon:yes stop_codon:yes gene_type:complete